jgi:hypothetical protein
MVCAQVVKNESKWEWQHLYVSMTRGMKSLPNVRSMYDRVFSWATIITTCVVVVNVHCTIFVWVESTMMMSINIRKSSLVIRISIHHWVWQGKRWEASFKIFAPLSKVIVTTISQSVSWALYIHSHKGTKTNGYLNCPWYDHTNTVINGLP